MQEINEAFRAYIVARRHIHSLSEKNKIELRGNDNMVGRLGEYLAVLHLRSVGLNPRKTRSKSQRGYDLICDGRRFSVKILTSENEAGRSTRLKDPWTDFILVHFEFDTFTYKLGHITRKQFAAARRKYRSWSKTPVVKKTMLGTKGLFGIGGGQVFERVL